MPVFHIVHEALDPRSPVFRPGSARAEIHPDMAVLPGEHLVLKHFPGSFTQTALEAYGLPARTRSSSAVIRPSCATRQARERGFQVRFASDATAARDQRVNGKLIPHAVIHAATLAVMQTQFGAQVATAAEIAALLR